MFFSNAKLSTVYSWLVGAHFKHEIRVSSEILFAQTENDGTNNPRAYARGLIRNSLWVRKFGGLVDWWNLHLSDQFPVCAQVFVCMN